MKQPKSILRKIILDRRKQVSIQQQELLSKLICQRIKILPQYQAATQIAFYSAVNHEVNLQLLFISSFNENKVCYYPRMENQSLIFLPVTPETQFILNHYNIPEPITPTSMALSPEELDLILIPTVGFDAQCNRLGMGGGFYDRFLKSLKAYRMGVAYEFQYQDTLPIDDWDIPLDTVVTEQNFYSRDLLLNSSFKASSTDKGTN